METDTNELIDDPMDTGDEIITSQEVRQAMLEMGYAGNEDEENNNGAQPLINTMVVPGAPISIRTVQRVTDNFVPNNPMVARTLFA